KIFILQILYELTLGSHLNDGEIAIRGGICLSLEAGLVVPVDVAPDDPATSEQVLREKPVSDNP
ncbi:MAG: hypothetical protein QXY59_04515, partial [Candidatus Korarchaeota archaeon]